MKKLKQVDPQIAKLIAAEEKRQKSVLEMIPSENFASFAVRETLSSVLTDKYSEGYPRKRYYQGNKVVDEVEQLAIDRAKKLFGVPYANVQAYSGSPANSAIMFALLEPGDKIMGLALSSGGHLTHGHPKVTFSGKIFNSVQYSVEEDGRIDYDKLEKLALQEKPKMIIAGTTAYPRTLEFKCFAQIADKVGAILLADVSHIAGLIVGGVHPSPVPYAHVIMATTHKTLRGPRGALILVTEKGLKLDPKMGDKIDSAIIPGLQGGPHNNTIAGIAVCLKEAATPAFKRYSQQIVKNAKVLSEELMKRGVNLVSGGTDNHLLVIDLRAQKKMGNIVAYALELAGIVANKNTVPGEIFPPFYSSGVRLGTPAITTLGLKEREMKKIAAWIAEVIAEVKPYNNVNDLQDKEKRARFFQIAQRELEESVKLKGISSRVILLTKRFQ